MSTERAAHTDRLRAESFGSVAANYDRYRPAYPDELIADLLALNPSRVLDVACGTGKLAVPLMACGVAVLGVEVDAKMAAVAASHGIVVEQAAFEQWDAEGRTFPLVTCGQAWHWIAPEAGARKAADVLEPGGTLALVWNRDAFDDAVQREVDRVYAEFAPALAAVPAEVDPGADGDQHVANLERSGVFADIDVRRYRWQRTDTTAEVIGRLATQSNHITLPDEQRARLLDALGRVVDEAGGSVETRYTTHAVLARTPG